jgi:hypothetical protein
MGSASIRQPALRSSFFCEGGLDVQLPARRSLSAKEGSMFFGSDSAFHIPKSAFGTVPHQSGTILTVAENNQQKLSAHVIVFKLFSEGFVFTPKLGICDCRGQIETACRHEYSTASGKCNDKNKPD